MRVTEQDRQKARDCSKCNGWVFTDKTGWVRSRETTGLVCQKCGWDYGRDGEP
jgi:RNase P subunit RPR2